MPTPATPAKTWSDAVRAGRGQIRAASAPAPRLWYGLCLRFVRTALGIPAVYPSAIAAWKGAQNKHTAGPPPAGAPVFWSGGAYGHIALSVGGGRVLSTDIRRRGHVDEVAIDLVHDRWGLTYLGWSEDLNGRPVDLAGRPTKPAQPKDAPAPSPREDDDMSQAQYDALMKAIDEVKEDVRDYALWQVLYELETEDERAQAQAAFDEARAAGKSIAEAKHAAVVVLQSLVDDVKKSQARK